MGYPEWNGRVESEVIGPMREENRRLRAQIQELFEDLKHHEAWEGEPVEVRTRNGSWRDVASYFEEEK